MLDSFVSPRGKYGTRTLTTAEARWIYIVPLPIFLSESRENTSESLATSAVNEDVTTQQAKFRGLEIMCPKRAEFKSVFGVNT